MPLFDFFKNVRDIFGLPPSHNYNYPNQYNNTNGNYYDNNGGDDGDDDDDNRDPFSRGQFGGTSGFFSEDFANMAQQMDEMMRLFDHMMGISSSFGGFEGGFIDENARAPIMEGGIIRDQYLKPGFQNKPHNGSKSTDTDLDGVIAPNDLNDLIIRGNESRPSNNSPKFYSKTIVTRTITKPDGTIETRRTVKDNTTNEEETTVTVKQREDGPRDKIVPFGPGSDESINWRKFFKF